MTRGRRCSQPCVRDPRAVNSSDRPGAARGGDRKACGQGTCPRHDGRILSMAVIEDVRPLGAELERSYQVYVRGRLKFRVKQIVYVAFSRDETVMGFGFPKEERAALVQSAPHKFQLPRASDMRFHWVEADLAALDPAEAR